VKQTYATPEEKNQHYIRHCMWVYGYIWVRARNLMTNLKY